MKINDSLCLSYILSRTRKCVLVSVDCLYLQTVVPVVGDIQAVAVL
jgi:hypothetical protein